MSMGNYQATKMSSGPWINPLRRPVTSGLYQTSCPDSLYSESSSARVLTGNLAPGGAIAKITGKEGLGFTGKARVFDSEEEFVHAVEAGSIKKGEKTIVVLRYLGPKGGPGMSFERSASVAIDPTKM
jgi:dihydroxyacid dehydratase/phosphogluconate dehydratase